MTKKIALQIKSDIYRIGIEEILKETGKYSLYSYNNIEELKEQAIKFDLLLFEDASIKDLDIQKIQIIEENRLPLVIEHSLITIKISKEELIQAVEKTFDRCLYIEERLKEIIETRKKQYNNLENLSQRELTIIEGIIEEKTNKEISKVLYISEKTVKNNLTEIYKKLEVKNRIELQKNFKNLLTRNLWNDIINKSQLQVA